MKKIINKINVSLVAILCTGPVMAVTSNWSGVDAGAFCLLLDSLHSVFNMLRMVCFVGAAFIVANWAWEFITSGKFEVKTLKDKGTSMLVGFVLLFGIGLIMQFLLSGVGYKTLGCADDVVNW